MYAAIDYTIDANNVLTWGTNFTRYSSMDMETADVIEDYNEVMTWLNANVTSDIMLSAETESAPQSGYIVLNYVEKYTYDGTTVTKIPSVITVECYQTDYPDLNV